MALRLQVPRLLIADDVGIGKTIEAGLILRELMDRGEVDAFSVLCPPHLVEQWVGELKARFGIEAVAVTSGTASRLERGLPLAQTLFDAYPFTVVSLDYIKAEKRREGFARACPDLVIVDEAHACVGTHKGRQQRFELLSGLARNPDRRMILLTATPHSGDEEAFGRLLSLVEPSFTSMNFEDARYRERLARHFVQRRRIDLVSGIGTKIAPSQSMRRQNFPIVFLRPTSNSRKPCSITASASFPEQDPDSGSDAWPSGARWP